MIPVPSLSSGIPMRNRFILGLLYLFLVVDVLNGPLRYYMSSIGLSTLMYLPKLIIGVVVITATLRTLYRGLVRPVFATTLVVFVVYFLIGWIFTSNLLQAAFGVFVLLPLIYSVLAEPALRQAGNRLMPFIALLWATAAVGVVFDYLWDMPWTGLTYQLVETEIEGSREWTTFGVERVAGFARASFAAADQLLLLALPLMFFSRSRILRILIWLTTGMLIYLTTTKKTGGIFLILTLLIPLMNFAFAPALLRHALTMSVPILIAAIGIGLPLSTIVVTYRLNLDSLLSQVLFASFEDRLTVVWPAGLQLLIERGSAVFGRGIGGIGAAQNYFEQTVYSPADNLYLYLYVTFGILALGFMAAYVWNLTHLDTQRSAWSRMIWTIGIAILAHGWAGNVLEGSMTATMMGVTLAYAHTEWQRRLATVRQIRIERQCAISSPHRFATPWMP